MEISNRKKTAANQINLSSINEGHASNNTGGGSSQVGDPLNEEEDNHLLEFEDNDAKKANAAEGRSRHDRKKANFKMSTVNSNEPPSQLNNTSISNPNRSPRFLRIFGPSGDSGVAAGGGGGGSSSLHPNHNSHHRYDPSPTRVPARNAAFNSYRSSMEFYRLKLSRSKLKAVTRTSALLSGFAMVAMVELGLDYSDYFEDKLKAKHLESTTLAPQIAPAFNLTLNSTNSTTNLTEPIKVSNSIGLEDEVKAFLVPEPILILYALVTCLLVGVHMLALMISTCILPQVEATALDSFELEQQFYDHKNTIINQSNHMISAAITAAIKTPPPAAHAATTTTPNSTVPAIHINGDSTVNPSPNTLNQSNRFLFQEALTATEILFPYTKFHHFIELAWISSTVIGIFLFLVEIGIVCYIKFYPISTFAAMAGAMVMAPILVLFVIFTVTFYRRLAALRLGLTKLFLHEIDHNLQPFKDHPI